MAKIDSGLGWSCNVEYYVNNAGAHLATVKNKVYSKYLTGPAICVCEDTNGHSVGPRVFSTVYDNVRTNQYDEIKSYVIDGVTWYYRRGMSEDTDDYSSSFPVISDGGYSGAEFVRYVLTLAGVLGSPQTIPVQFVRQGGVLQDSFDITVLGA